METDNLNDLPEYITFKQIAKILQVSIGTVKRYTYATQNPLPTVKLSRQSPRVAKSAFIAWIDRQNEYTKTQEGL